MEHQSQPQEPNWPEGPLSQMATEMARLRQVMEEALKFARKLELEIYVSGVKIATLKVTSSDEP